MARCLYLLLTLHQSPVVKKWVEWKAEGIDEKKNQRAIKKDSHVGSRNIFGAAYGGDCAATRWWLEQSVRSSGARSDAELARKTNGTTGVIIDGAVTGIVTTTMAVHSNFDRPRLTLVTTKALRKVVKIVNVVSVSSIGMKASFKMPLPIIVRA